MRKHIAFYLPIITPARQLPGTRCSRKNLADFIFQRIPTAAAVSEIVPRASDRRRRCEIMHQPWYNTRRKAQQQSCHISFTRRKGERATTLRVWRNFHVFSIRTFVERRFCEANAGSFIRWPIKSLLQLNHISNCALCTQHAALKLFTCKHSAAAAANGDCRACQLLPTFCSDLKKKKKLITITSQENRVLFGFLTRWIYIWRSISNISIWIQWVATD